MACMGCGESVLANARFCSVCGRSVVAAPVPPPPLQRRGASPELDGLYRPREGRMLAGVCRGFSTRYGWEVSLVRFVLILSVLLGAGVPVLLYVIAWVVMPNGQYALPATTGMGAGSMRV